jgi:photosystem II stability/assembly factor-like uncharacterized protein
MTSNVDRQLSDAAIERMLRARAAGAPPVELAPTIAALAREVVQRPAARSTIPGLRRGRGALLLVAATLVTGTIVGVTIVGNRDLSVPSERPVAPAELSASPASSVAVPSVVVPAAVPSPSVVQSVGAPHDFSAEAWSGPHLITDEIGWVVTVASLYRTTDGGRTWTDTAPPHDGPITEQAVVDADTAFVASSQGSSSAIAATHDGGASWSVASLPVEARFGLTLLLFHSPLVGSVSFYRQDDRLQVYRTTDGGATFESPTIGSIPGREKLAGRGNGVMWLNLGKADNRPFDNDHLWMSSDGGATWQARRFPVARWVRADELKWIVGTPLISGDGRIVLAISDGDRTGLFRSDDDGRTWQELAAVPAPPGGARNATYHVTDTDWVYTDEPGALLLTSDDAGQHWRALMGDQINGSDSYASPTHAWTFHGCSRKPRPFGTRRPDPWCDGNTLASLLLETTDGGRSWHQLGQ